MAYGRVIPPPARPERGSRSWTVRVIALTLPALLALLFLTYGKILVNRMYEALSFRGRCILHPASYSLTSQGFGSQMQMVKSTLILSDFLQIPIGFEWYEGGYWPYHISDWLVKNHCQTLANRTDFLRLSEGTSCTLRHDLLSGLLDRICSRDISVFELEGILGISDCSVIYDPSSPGFIENYNDCASSWFGSNILPEAPQTASSNILRIGVHFRAGDVHLDGEHAYSDLKVIGNIVRVLDATSTLDPRSILFREAVQFLSNMDAKGCEIKLKVYAMGVEEVVGLPFPYELVNTGSDRRDFLDYVSNDVMIQGISSFSALAAFATGKHKVIVTNQKAHPKYAQRAGAIIDVLQPTDAFKIVCPHTSVGFNFAYDN